MTRVDQSVRTVTLVATDKSAELKLLYDAGRRLVVVAAALDQLERPAKHLAQGRRIVAHEGQAAASLGTIRSERPDNDVAALSTALATRSAYAWRPFTPPYP